jgi:hypothetical protein
MRDRDLTADRRKNRRLRRRYGISLEVYEEILSRQGGVCAICGVDGSLQVDHDHELGDVRGLLCRDCNIGLGHFLDRPELLRAAITYLKSHSLSRALSVARKEVR